MTVSKSSILFIDVKRQPLWLQLVLKHMAHHFTICKNFAQTAQYRVY